MACLLEPQYLLQYHQKLHGHNGSIQFAFLRDTVKSYSVEIGHLQTTIDISLKDSFESAVVILHKNTAVVGDYQEHILKWQPHDLQRAFLETGLNIK